MTVAAFRRLALALLGTTESSHMAHPDFRVGNKIFATLGCPDARSGMVKLSPDQQAKLVSRAPETFRPATGAWGRNGSTLVLLASATVSTLGPVLRQAWANARMPLVRKKKPLR